MLQEFIYQAYGYASEQINLIHGQDFFSVGAQPKYSALFASYMMYYLNNIALHGMFLSYEIANSGLVPSLGASGKLLKVWNTALWASTLELFLMRLAPLEASNNLAWDAKVASLEWMNTSR